MPYRAPVNEFRFLFDHVVDLASVTAEERFAEATPDTVEAILTEAGRMCEEVIAPTATAPATPIPPGSRTASCAPRRASTPPMPPWPRADGSRCRRIPNTAAWACRWRSPPR